MSITTKLVAVFVILFGLLGMSGLALAASSVLVGY